MHSVLSFLLQFFLEDLARDLWIRNDCWCTGLSVCRSQQSRPRVHERWIRGLETICQESVRIPPPPTVDSWQSLELWKKKKSDGGGHPGGPQASFTWAPLPFWVSLWLHRTVYVVKTVLHPEAEGEGWVCAGNILPGFKSYFFSTALTDPGEVFSSLLQYLSFPSLTM